MKGSTNSSCHHATASVEGAVNITRNNLGDRSHNLTEPNIEAKKVVKSAVREASTDCCFEYKVTQDHHNNWKKAYQELTKSNVKAGSDESDSSIDEEKDLRLIQEHKKKEVTYKKRGAVDKKRDAVDKKSNAVDQKRDAVDKREAVDKQRDAVDKKRNAVDKKKEVVDKKEEAVAKNNEAVAKNNEAAAKKNGAVAKKKEVGVKRKVTAQKDDVKQLRYRFFVNNEYTVNI